MMRSKRIFALLLVALLSLGTATAYGDSGTTVELKVSGIPGQIANILYMNKELFEASHPGVTVSITEYPEDQYQNQTPQIFGDKSTRPDVSWYWNQFWYNDFAASGMFMPLDDLYESEGWADAIGASTMESFRFSDGHIYTVCDDVVWTPVLYYNKGIFEALNLQIPKTQDELYAMAETLTAAGYVPVAVGATDAVPDHVYNVILQRSVTPEEYAKLLDFSKQYDEIRYDSPKIVGVFEELKKMSEKVFQQGATGVNSTEARSMFLQSKAAMYSDGSWAVGMINQEKPDGMEVGVFPYPQIHEDISPAIPLFTGNCMQILADTEYPELAKAFLAQVMSKEGQSEMAKRGIGSPARSDIPEAAASMGELFVTMYNDMANIGTVPLWWANQKGEVINRAYAIQSAVMAGATEPETAAKELQALFEESLR